MTVMLTTLMRFIPASDGHCLQRVSGAWWWRLLRGDMALGGSTGVGLGMAAVLWWCITAGILVSFQMRAALFLTAGGGVLVALVNAGRRARLSTTQTFCLCGALSAGGVLLLMVAVRLWISLSGR